MLFNFKLTPVEEVGPWGRPQGEPSLHWFGLTDGEYWIQAGDAALLEYSEHTRRNRKCKRYCDYQVARLYEDVFEMVPQVLDPIPAELVPYISGDSGRAWEAKFALWEERDDHDDEDQFWALREAVGVLWRGRLLDSMYLSTSANIRMWSDHTLVHIEWDTRDISVDGFPVWSASHGSYELSRDDFVAEVRSFHERLIKAMDDRIEQVLAGGLSPEIQIDLPGLQHEHEQRSRLAKCQFDRPSVPTAWDRVLGAIIEIERLVEAN